MELFLSPPVVSGCFGQCSDVCNLIDSFIQMDFWSLITAKLHFKRPKESMDWYWTFYFGVTLRPITGPSQIRWFLRCVRGTDQCSGSCVLAPSPAVVDDQSSLLFFSATHRPWHCVCYQLWMETRRLGSACLREFAKNGDAPPEYCWLTFGFLINDFNII